MTRYLIGGCCWLALLAGVMPDPLLAARVETSTNIDGEISGEDSLQDVFPEATLQISDGLISPSLVDGLPDPAEGLPQEGYAAVLSHAQGPALITWDLGKSAVSDGAQLDSLVLWIVSSAAQYPPNFKGKIQVSNDGKVFRTIAGTATEIQGESGDKFTRVRWTFEPGEVKGFRYLRIFSSGYNGQSLLIGEIDGWISGITVAKSSAISMELASLATRDIVNRPPNKSQAQSAPMNVQAVELRGEKLVTRQNSKTLLDFGSFLKVPDARWKQMAEANSTTEAKVSLRRDDGLLQTRKVAISQDLVRLSVEVSLPSDSSPVEYGETSIVVHEAGEEFDGVTYGTVPSFVKRNFPTRVEMGEWAPYLIFPSKKADFEVQVFMPAWYNIPGRIQTFTDEALLRMDLFAAAKNRQGSIDEKSSKQWQETMRMIGPGEKICYELNLAVFGITPMTLGQKDIEYSGMLPLIGVDTGVPNQTAPGTPTVVQRDKMLFMGFKLREPLKEKIGHLAVEPSGNYTAPGIVDRLRRAGVGAAVLMGDEFIDVSHGVSKQGNYDESQPFLPDVLEALTASGIKPLYWFSPRGFLNKAWMDRPKDMLLDEHPDWFLPSAHWFGNYQTIDSFNEAANQWVIDKMEQDLSRFPELRGFAFDTFPSRGTILGGDKDVTLTAQDQMWLQRFSKAVHSLNPENLVMANGTPPTYDDTLSLDYTVTEHFPLMFLNEVLGGRTFGKSFVAHTRWRQLYGWYVTLDHLYYNFCDYDQPLGWMHMTWLGWLNDQVQRSRKPIDEQVIPLWYIMGKGTRVYAAEIAENVRQIETEMPDGSRILAIASMSLRKQDVQVVPQTMPGGSYLASVSTDTCLDHKEFPPIVYGIKGAAGFLLKEVPAYSITLIRFKATP